MRTHILTAALVGLSLAGVVVSSLALREHYSNEPSPCRIDAVWDCGIVNQSPFAVIRGVPVAMIGILGYALLAALAGRFPRVVALAAVLSTAFALRLTWIEWRVLQVWCIYCVTSQAIIFAVLVLSLVQAFVPTKVRITTQT